MEAIEENIDEKIYNSLQGIRTVKEGKRFESYVGWGFIKEIDCEQYIQDADFSFQFEKIQIENILTQQKLEEDEKKKILSDLNEFENALKNLKPEADKNTTSKNESKSDNKKSITTSSEDIDQNLNITYNMDKNINDNIITNNNVLLIDNNIDININKAKGKKEKKNKKNKPKINKKDDISGDFDIIIPKMRGNILTNRIICRSSGQPITYRICLRYSLCRLGIVYILVRIKEADLIAAELNIQGDFTCGGILGAANIFIQNNLVLSVSKLKGKNLKITVLVEIVGQRLPILDHTQLHFS